MTDLKVLFSELIRLETDLWNGVDARLRSEHDLQLTWFEPMQVMAKHPACRVYDIKEELSITVGGVSKLVDRIEAAGLCRRRANRDDGRSQLIELTPAGRRLLAKATKTFEGELQARLGSVASVRSLDHFVATLTKLRTANRRCAPDAKIASASQGGPAVRLHLHTLP
jgi:DNA-binding MarR family transcriptional regulator